MNGVSSLCRLRLGTGGLASTLQGESMWILLHDGLDKGSHSSQICDLPTHTHTHTGVCRDLNDLVFYSDSHQVSNISPRVTLQSTLQHQRNPPVVNPGEEGLRSAPRRKKRERERDANHLAKQTHPPQRDAAKAGKTAGPANNVAAAGARKTLPTWTLHLAKDVFNLRHIEYLRYRPT